MPIILGQTFSNEVLNLDEFALRSTHKALHNQKLMQFTLLTWKKVYPMLIKVNKAHLVNFKQCKQKTSIQQKQKGERRSNAK